MLNSVHDAEERLLAAPASLVISTYIGVDTVVDDSHPSAISQTTDPVLAP